MASAFGLGPELGPQREPLGFEPALALELRRLRQVVWPIHLLELNEELSGQLLPQEIRGLVHQASAVFEPG